MENGYKTRDIEGAVINKRYSISASYDGKAIRLRNNSDDISLAESGNIGYPEANSWMLIGANPYGSTASSGYYLKGAVYSARIYNRALTDEEREVNYKADQKRYGV